ncbi:MAG TPA: AbrB/MazE/SpoVT family DNA-binding domain-containing protein [Nitrososphaerales archaeon]|nr:AbrB/MazE/SpoVT family DNA-binding domain-containing protein [Nitrososphaerales archaeon]
MESKGKSYYPIHSIGVRYPLRAKIARRYQITIPEEVRDEVGMNVGDTVDVRSQGEKVIIEKIGRNWKAVMNETRGSWKEHPVFQGMKDSTEIVDWLRQKSKKR